MEDIDRRRAVATALSQVALEAGLTINAEAAKEQTVTVNSEEGWISIYDKRTNRKVIMPVELCCIPHAIESFQDNSIVAFRLSVLLGLETVDLREHNE